MQQSAFSIEPILIALGQDITAVSFVETSEKYPTIHQSHTPNQFYEAVRTIGNLLGVEEQAEQLIAPLEERTNIIEHKLKFITADQRPSVLCLQDVSPPSVSENSYVDALIRLAGGAPFGDVQGDTFRPDLLLIVSDKPVPTLFGELPALLGSNTWAATPAVEKNNIFIINNPKALRNPGMGIADDTEILAEIISSKYFVYGNEGTSWIRFELA